MASVTQQLNNSGGRGIITTKEAILAVGVKNHPGSS